MREFESEHKDVCYKDESKNLKDRDKIIKDSDQNQWDWVRMSNRKKDFYLNWLIENSIKYIDKLNISYVEWIKEESYLNS